MPLTRRALFAHLARLAPGAAVLAVAPSLLTLPHAGAAPLDPEQVQWLAGATPKLYRGYGAAEFTPLEARPLDFILSRDLLTDDGALLARYLEGEFRAAARVARSVDHFQVGMIDGIDIVNASEPIRRQRFSVPQHFPPTADLRRGIVANAWLPAPRRAEDDSRYVVGPIPGQNYVGVRLHVRGWQRCEGD